jgi:hypothetical protein
MVPPVYLQPHFLLQFFSCSLSSFCELKILPHFEDLNWSVMLFSSWVFMPTEKQHIAGLRPDIGQVQYGKRSTEDNDVAQIK